MPSFDQPRSIKTERKSNNRKTEINENSSFETNGGKSRGGIVEDLQYSFSYIVCEHIIERRSVTSQNHGSTISG